MHYLERLGRRPSAGTEGGLDSLSSDALLADLRKCPSRLQLCRQPLYHAVSDHPVQCLRTQMCQAPVIQHAQLINRKKFLGIN
jgi:hypothetical protein